MSASIKLGLTALGCFIAGILVGMTFGSSDTPRRVETNHVEATDSESSGRILSMEAGETTYVETVSVDEPNPIQRRLQRVAGLAEVGVPTMVSPFNGERLNPVFVLLLDLTERETSQIETALAATTQRFQEIENQAATAGLSSDGKKLIVKVPPMPQAGGEVYDALLDSFASILGEDRFALFNEVSRQSFDQRFDGFGLNTVTYDVNLTPVVNSQGNPTFQIVRSYVAPNGVSKGSSTSQLDLKGINRFYPVVVKFLPLEFQQ